VSALRYQVLLITAGEECVVESSNTLTGAFDGCVAKWRVRRTGGPVYAVRDTETEQRWSYRDIQDLRQGAA